MSFQTVPACKHDATIAVYVRSDCGAKRLTVTFNQKIADALSVGVGDRIGIKIGEGKDAGKFLLYKYRFGALVFDRGHGGMRYQADSSVTKLDTAPFRAKWLWMSEKIESPSGVLLEEV